MALDDFRFEARDADDALVFYAGHGLNLQERDILAPVDMPDICEGGPVKRAVDLDVMLKAAYGARNKIVLLNATRADPFPRCPTRGLAAGSLQVSFCRALWAWRVRRATARWSCL